MAGCRSGVVSFLILFAVQRGGSGFQTSKRRDSGRTPAAPSLPEARHGALDRPQGMEADREGDGQRAWLRLQAALLSAETALYWHGDVFDQPTNPGTAILGSAPPADWAILVAAVLLCALLDFFVMQRFAPPTEEPRASEEVLREAFADCGKSAQGDVTTAEVLRLWEKRPDVAALSGLSGHEREGGLRAAFNARPQHWEVEERARITWEDFRQLHTPKTSETQAADSPAAGNLFASAAVLLFWVLVAAAFNGIVLYRRGWDSGVQWCSGYMLEWLLSFDNLFVFHLVFATYKTPRGLLHKALFLGILGAVVFRMFFFMALSSLLHLVHWIRFVFGIILIYSGVQAARGDDDEESIADSWPVKLLKTCLGSRLSEDYDAEGRLFCRSADGRLRATLLVPVIVCLEVTDILFAVDSVSAKLAQIPDYYIAYSSSVLAIFGLRAMFFIVRDLVDYFELLKYGLCFILVFIGIELIFSDYLRLPAQVVCVIILSVFLVCIAGSTAQKLYGTSQKDSRDVAAEADHS
mmetsp:Transcript_31245/g.89590  ORF Transcript_31245/g.89590 Transcript_31245/m.89590 type:complete len:523 (-) Transcript_31245:107-1675(-)